ncbi:hypothetical protein [Amylibacter sp. IMCC11727]|nr:hypothetical protein [Amylibacter sp. IMCC11727]WGI21210.1 hypothetical protein QBD29_13985 [Amylibacter sp. IMCC11727]
MSWSLIMSLLEGEFEAEDASVKAEDHRQGRSFAMVEPNPAQAAA